MRTQRLIAYAFAACVVSLSVGSAMADDEGGTFNARLKGTYRHMAGGSCATAGAAGFTSFPYLQALEAGSTGPGAFTGVITYEGNGHATETIRGIGLADGPYDAGSFPVLTFEETCDWTYEVKPNGSFIRKGTCRGTTTGGQFTGSPYTLSDIKWRGQIGDEGSVLTSIQVDPVEQRLSNGFLTKRICATHGTEVRIQRP